MRVVIHPSNLRFVWTGVRCDLCVTGRPTDRFALQIVKRTPQEMCVLSLLKVCGRCAVTSRGTEACYRVSPEALQRLLADVQGIARGQQYRKGAKYQPDWQRTMIAITGLAIGPYVRQPACANCGRTKVQQECAQCSGVVYCSSACHAKHWRAGGHKNRCPTMMGKLGLWTFRLSSSEAGGAARAPKSLEGTLLMGEAQYATLQSCEEFFRKK